MFSIVTNDSSRFSHFSIFSWRDRLRITQVSKKWREVLLQSPNLWVIEEYNDNLGVSPKLRTISLDAGSLSAFRLFLSKRRHARPVVLGTSEPQSLSELVDTLNAYAPNKIEGLDLGWRNPVPFTWNVHVLTKLPSLQSLRFRSDSLIFETFSLTALTALTRLEAACLLVVVDKNCFPSSLRSLTLTEYDNRSMYLEGSQNLRTVKLTSLILRSAFGFRNSVDPDWVYESLCEIETLQNLEIDCNLVDIDLHWPREVSRLTALTKLKLGYVYNYDSSKGSISNLRNLQSFELACWPVAADSSPPTGLFELPLLDTVSLSGRGRFKFEGPAVWQIETLTLELQSIVRYDFSQPLLHEPRLKHLTINGVPPVDGLLPAGQTDAINSTLESLLRFLAPLKTFKSLKFSRSILSGRVTQGTVGRIVEFVQKRPDVEMDLNIPSSDRGD